MTESMKTDFEAGVTARVEAVLVLRKDLTVPAPGDGPVAVLEALMKVRGRLDQVEENLTQLFRLRGAVRRAACRAKDDADDQWNQTVTGTHRPRRGDFGEAAPRERYAQADLAVLTQRRTERALADQVAVAEEAVEVSQLVHRGLSDIRRDLHVMLRGIELESALER